MDEMFTFTPRASGGKGSYSSGPTPDHRGKIFDLDASTATFLALAKELNDTKNRAQKQLLLQRIKDEVIKPFVEKKKQGSLIKETVMNLLFQEEGVNVFRAKKDLLLTKDLKK